jgi:hypothetical protein
MNPDDLVTNTVLINTDDYKIMTPTGLSSIGTSTISTNTISAASATMSTRWFDIEIFLDEHIMNRLTVDHKVQEQELLKLKEVAPDYANEIKDTIAKNAARDMVKKLTFTKKHDKDADVHHFIGRVWMFTEDELKNLIKEARSV